MAEKQSEAPPYPQRPRGMQLLKRLGEARDGLLLIGGGIYVLGYIVWSIHALDEGLGLLPALEFQYFLAGGIAAGIFFAGYGLAQLLKQLLTKKSSGTGFLADMERFFNLIYATVMSAVIAFFSVAFAIFAYVFLVYPNVPQELGGVKPRCGYIEVESKSLSASLGRNIFMISREPTIRSRKLSIFFSGGDAYVVRVRDIPHARVVEIRKDIVRSVINC